MGERPTPEHCFPDITLNRIIMIFFTVYLGDSNRLPKSNRENFEYYP